MDNTRIMQVVSSMFFSMILITYVFLLMPFTLYIGNINEFTVSFLSIIQAYTPVIIFIIGTFSLLGILLPVSMYRRYITLLATIGILLWIQGNLLVWDYGLLDGRSIDWSQDVLRSWIEVIIWGWAIIFSVLSNWAIGQRIIKFAIFLIVLQLGLFVFNFTSHASELADKKYIQRNQASAELFQFSSKKNVVHILADGFQSDIFEDIVTNSEDGRRVAKALDGFTFYRNHLGAFPYTHMSVPAFLSGQIYKNHMPITEFLETTMSGKTIFNAAYDSGYDVDLIVPKGLVYMYKNSRYTNLSGVPGKYHISELEFELRDAAKLFDLSAFRLSPHFLKKAIYNDQLWFTQLLLVDKKYLGLRFFSHTAFLRSLHKNLTADREKPVYKYLHLMLSHNPMVTNQQCGYAGRVLPTVRQTVTIQAKCGLNEVLALFDKMKKAGIYHDALIVLMADHGAWVPPKGLKIKLQNGRPEVIDPRVLALSLPLFAIKLPGDTGELRISDAPTWIIDTPATIAKGMNIGAQFEGHSVFELGQNDQRERQFFFYQYKRSEWTDKYLSPIHEFTINGRGEDSAAWEETVIYQPDGIVQTDLGKSGLWKKVNTVK